MGLNIFFAGFFWITPFSDFLVILITGENIINPYGWLGLFQMMWAPPVLIISIYIGAELMIPKIKSPVRAAYWPNFKKVPVVKKR